MRGKSACSGRAMVVIEQVKFPVVQGRVLLSRPPPLLLLLVLLLLPSTDIL